MIVLVYLNDKIIRKPVIYQILRRISFWNIMQLHLFCIKYFFFNAMVNLLFFKVYMSKIKTLKIVRFLHITNFFILILFSALRI